MGPIGHLRTDKAVITTMKSTQQKNVQILTVVVCLFEFLKIFRVTEGVEAFSNQMIAEIIRQFSHPDKIR